MRFGVTAANKHTSTKADTNSPSCYLYAYAWGGKIDNSSDYYHEKKVDFALVTDLAAEKTDRVEQVLHALLLRVIVDIDSAALPLEVVQRNAIKQLKRGLTAKNPPQLP